MENRRELMNVDVAAVIDTCSKDSKCPFRNFVFQREENIFKFSCKKFLSEIHFIFNLSDDYPDQTLISRSDGKKGAKGRIASDRIPILFTKLSKELNKEVRVPLPPSPISSLPPTPVRHPVQEKTMTIVDEPAIINSTCKIENSPTLTKIEPPPPPPPTTTQNTSLMRMVSEESHYSDCVSDAESVEIIDVVERSESEDEYDYEYYYNDNESVEVDHYKSEINPLLSHDMDLVNQRYGESAINYRLFGSIDDIDIEFNIDMSFLEEETAKAWKIIRAEPIVVRLHLSFTGYLDASEPKIEVFQPSNKERFGLGSQLRKILEAFISQEWKKLSNEYVAKQHIVPVGSLTESSPLRKKGRAKDETHLGNQSMNDDKPTSDNNEKSVNDHSLATLIDMGFEHSLARNALIMTQGNIQEATEFLASSSTDHNVDCMIVDETPAARSLTTKPPTTTGRQLSTGKIPPDKASKTRRQFSAGTPAVADMVAAVATAGEADLTLMPTSTSSGQMAKKIPGLEFGFLCQVMQYTCQRIPTLNEYCVVCDEQHVFQNGAMLKPAVCARELCVFAFQTLGVMSDAADDIATGAEVVDLLIAMASAACRSHRKEVIFDPFPTIVDPKNPTELALHPKFRDYQRVQRALDTFPIMAVMTKLLGNKLKQEMDKRDILAYPLLQWIITSNRSHIVKLPKEKQLKFMHTPHQFLLLCSPPAKEAMFRTAKKEHGSIFAFHGSHIENWHSIMRNGLINASGTKHQMHGAAYGEGIYLSPSGSLSFGYSGMGYGNCKQLCQKKSSGSGESGKPRFLTSRNLTCIALCEVIAHPTKLKKHGSVWVNTDNSLVCTRFFFVYEDGQIGDSNVDTNNDRFKAQIEAALEI